jgi:hypothetical protein
MTLSKKFTGGKPVPEAREGLDMGGKWHIKTLLEHLEDCHFRWIA